MKTAVRRTPILAPLYGAPTALLGGLIGLGGAVFLHGGELALNGAVLRKGRDPQIPAHSYPENTHHPAFLRGAFLEQFRVGAWS